jgi:hypothetical protein
MCYKTVMVSYKNGTITKRYSYKTVHYKTVHRHYGVLHSILQSQSKGLHTPMDWLGLA